MKGKAAPRVLSCGSTTWRGHRYADQTRVTDVTGGDGGDRGDGGDGGDRGGRGDRR